MIPNINECHVLYCLCSVMGTLSNQRSKMENMQHMQNIVHWWLQNTIFMNAQVTKDIDRSYFSRFLVRECWEQSRGIFVGDVKYNPPLSKAPICKGMLLTVSGIYFATDVFKKSNGHKIDDTARPRGEKLMLNGLSNLKRSPTELDKDVGPWKRGHASTDRQSSIWLTQEKLRCGKSLVMLRRRIFSLLQGDSGKMPVREAMNYCTFTVVKVLCWPQLMMQSRINAYFTEIKDPTTWLFVLICYYYRKRSGSS